MNATFKTIGIVDDHALFRNVLTCFFENHTRYKVILHAGNGKELQKLLTGENIPDLLLVDMRMPQMNGLETMRWLNEHFAGLPVIILTSCDTDLTLSEFCSLGARAVLQKSVCEKELLKAINRIEEEGWYCNSPSSLRTMLRTNGKSCIQDTNYTSLSEREQLLIQLSATDMVWEKIASAIYLSKGGLEKMCKRLFSRFGVKNRTTLALKAERNGLIPLPQKQKGQ